MNQIDKVLDSIDMVDDVTLEYSFNIVDSMFKAYEKSAIILENYEGDDLSSFTIFQEGEIMDDVKKQGEGQGTLMKILTALPRLIIAVFRKLTGSLSKASKKASSINQKIQNSPQEAKEILDVTFNNTKDEEHKTAKIKNILSNIKNKISQNKETIVKVAKGTVGILAVSGVAIGGTIAGKKAVNSIKERSTAKKEAKNNNKDGNDVVKTLDKDIQDFINKYTKQTKELFDKEYQNIINAWNNSRFEKHTTVEQKHIQKLRKCNILITNNVDETISAPAINSRFLYLSDTVMSSLIRFSNHDYGAYDSINDALANDKNIFDMQSDVPKSKSEWQRLTERMNRCIDETYDELFKRGLNERNGAVFEKHTNGYPINSKNLEIDEKIFQEKSKSVAKDLAEITEKSKELLKKIKSDEDIDSNVKINMQKNGFIFVKFLEGMLNVMKAIDQFQSAAVSLIDKAVNELSTISARIGLPTDTKTE